jgi:hypothetical protein
MAKSVPFCVSTILHFRRPRQRGPPHVLLSILLRRETNKPIGRQFNGEERSVPHIYAAQQKFSGGDCEVRPNHGATAHGGLARSDHRTISQTVKTDDPEELGILDHMPGLIISVCSDKAKLEALKKEKNL